MPRHKKKPAAIRPPGEAPMNNPFQAARGRLQAVLAQRAPAAGPPASPPSAPRAGQGRRPPGAAAPAPQSDEDLFAQEMAGVRRIDESDRVRGRRAPAPLDVRAPQRASEEAEVMAALADLVEGNGAWDIADSDEYIEGLAPGLDRRLLDRLRRGEYAVQGHLDLHGLRSDEARARVERFIGEARTAGKRCVLIIHGRGLNSKDQIPVLKERLRVWLTRGRISRGVLCFSTARPGDGGAGAVYVLLRR